MLGQAGEVRAAQESGMPPCSWLCDSTRAVGVVADRLAKLGGRVPVGSSISTMHSYSHTLHSCYSKIYRSASSEQPGKTAVDVTVVSRHSKGHKSSA
jgi:hypothetical protein